MENKIRVKGLAEFNRGLRKLDSEAPKQLRIALNGAAELLVDKAKPTVPSVTGNARASMKAKSTRTSARVSVGGKKAPYFPWLDFGGEGRIKGHPAHREFLKEGRYVYVTLGRISPDIEKALSDGIRKVARDAGLDVD